MIVIIIRLNLNVTGEMQANDATTALASEHNDRMLFIALEYRIQLVPVAIDNVLGYAAIFQRRVILITIYPLLRLHYATRTKCNKCFTNGL